MPKGHLFAIGSPKRTWLTLAPSEPGYMKHLIFFDLQPLCWVMFKTCFTEPVFKFIFCQEKGGVPEKGLQNVHNDVLWPPDVQIFGGGGAAGPY